MLINDTKRNPEEKYPYLIKWVRVSKWKQGKLEIYKRHTITSSDKMSLIKEKLKQKILLNPTNSNIWKTSNLLDSTKTLYKTPQNYK